MALNINEQTLRALQIAEKPFPVSSVALAAGVALSIFEIVQTVKINKEEFIAIGRDSCFIVETVVQKIRMGHDGETSNDPVILRHADMLLADLRYIEKCVRKVKGRSGVKKIFSYLLDQGAIQGCRERLAHAMDLFGFQYDIEIHRQLTTVHNLLVTVLEALSHSPSLRVGPQPQRGIPSLRHPPSPSPQIQGVPNMTPLSPTGSPTGTGFYSFRNIPNRRSPSVGHALVVGDGNDTRDESFNVFGTGNTIYLSFAR